MQPNQISGSGWAQATEIGLVRTASSSLYARLRSIEWDAKRVLRLHSHIAPSLPIFGNARAGAWYVPSGSGTCHFKSNDGHYNQWRVSSRSPNISLLREVLRAKGAVVVDATRAGKSWPDALSKTLPMWCAVVSALSAGLDLDDVDGIGKCLHVHPSVPESEQTSIRKRLPEFVRDWRESGADLEDLVPGFAELGDTLIRPVWVRADVEPGSSLWGEDYIPSSEWLGFIPVVCVSASPPFPPGTRSFIEADRPDDVSVVSGVAFPPRMSGFAYVQGAGDDQEAWSQGLSPQLFWSSRCQILEFAISRQNWLASDPRWNKDMESFLRTVLSEHAARRVRGQECAESLLHQACLDVVGSSPQTLCRDVGNAAEKLRFRTDSETGDSPRTVVVLSYSQSREAPKYGTTRVGADCARDATPVGVKVKWLNLADERGKPNAKSGLLKVMGLALELVEASSFATIICDSGQGDWALGLAVARLAGQQPLGPFAKRSGNLMDAAARSDTKQLVRRIVLRLAIEREDVRISRRTLQQVHAHFMAPVCKPV